MQASPNLDGLGCWRAAIRERFRPHLPDCGLFAQGEDKPARRVPSDMHPHFVQKSKMLFGVSQHERLCPSRFAKSSVNLGGKPRQRSLRGGTGKREDLKHT